MKKILRLKGWSEEDIRKASAIISQAEKGKHPHVRTLENSIYWFLLCIGILGTMIFALVLIPILLVGSNACAYFFTGFFGLILGTVIAVTVKDLHWFEQHHHLALSLLVPILAIFDFFIIVKKANELALSTGINNTHNPLIVGAVYFVCFVTPYIIILHIKNMGR